MDKFKEIALLIRHQRQHPTQKVLLDFLQKRICRYSNEEKTPAEQIKGMNRLINDILNLEAEYFEG